MDDGTDGPDAEVAEGAIPPPNGLDGLADGNTQAPVMEGLDTQPQFSRVCHEVVDLGRLREYCAIGVDTRMDQLQQYVALWRVAEADTAGVAQLARVYKRKSYTQGEIGREYPPWLSIPWLSRGAREAAAPDGTLSIDISNAQFFCCQQLGKLHNLPVVWLERFNAHKGRWRQTVQEYYKVPESMAKHHLFMTFFMRPYPPPECRHLGVLPFVECLAEEIRVIRATVCAARSDLVEAMTLLEKPNAEWSVFSLLLQEEEHMIVLSLLDCAAECGLGPPRAIIFDEVWFDGVANVDPQTVLDGVLARTGATVKWSRFQTAVAPVGQLSWRIRQLLAGGQLKTLPLRTIPVTGSATCLPFALLQLLPAHEMLQTFTNDRVDGPVTYKTMSDICCIEFTRVSVMSAVAGPGDFIIHEPRRTVGGIGHASALRVPPQEPAVYYDQCLDGPVAIPFDMLSGLLDGGQRIVLRVNVRNADGGRPGKRTRLAQGSTDEVLELFAGGGDTTSEGSADDMDGEVGPSFGYSLLLDWIASEKAAVLGSLQSYRSRGGEGGRVCPFCVRRVFTKKERLLRHIEKDHAAAHGCKFPKQLRVLRALWSEVAAAESARLFFGSTDELPPATRTPLQHSAAVMRQMLQTSPSFRLTRSTVTDWEDLTSWALTEDGYKLVVRSDVRALNLRPLRSIWYSEGALRLVLAFSLDPPTKGAARRVRDMLRKHFTARGCPAPFLLPGKNVVGKLQEICAEEYGHIRMSAIDRLVSSGDLQAISVDGTYKFLMPVLGQPRHGARRVLEPRDDEVHVVMTARSLSGALFFAEARFSEDAVATAQSLSSVQHVASSVQLIQVDRPYDWDTMDVQQFFPHLQAIGGDAFHLVIHTAACFGESMSPAVVQVVRNIQLRWTATTDSDWLQGPYFTCTGSQPQPFTVGEHRCASPNSHSLRAAKKVLDMQDPDESFASRSEYLSCMSAVLRVFQSDLRRRVRDEKVTLGDILRRALEPRCIEYLRNGWKWRNANGIHRRALAPGTTGNEGDHFDLKGWAWNIRSMAKKRAQTLLKFWVLSQLGRHTATHHFRVAGEGRRSDHLSTMILKFQFPHVAHGVEHEACDSEGFSRQDIRDASMGQRPKRGRPAHHKAKPVSKKPAAVLKLHQKEKLSIRKCMLVRRRPASVLTSSVVVAEL